jgi:hypothetical protein
VHKIVNLILIYYRKTKKDYKIRWFNLCGAMEPFSLCIHSPFQLIQFMIMV